jgi:hypothetical protein
MKKQKGFMLIGMMLVMGFLTLFVMKYSEYQHKKDIQENARSFYNRVLFLKQQMHAYVTWRYQNGSLINSAAIFPASLADLEGDFIAPCSSADNLAGKCMRYDQTPWGTIASSDYRRVGVPNNISPEYYRAEIDIKLPSKTDEAYEFERNATLSLFAQLPNIIYDDANNLITVRIDRPDKAFAYDGLVKRSGDDSTLLGDWDIGGVYGITNARDFLIKADGNNQISVSKRLVTIQNLSHGDVLRKPPCAASLTPQLTLNVAGAQLPDTHKNINAFDAYIDSENGWSWTIGLNVTSTNVSNGKEEITNAGMVTALIQCL